MQQPSPSRLRPWITWLVKLGIAALTLWLAWRLAAGIEWEDLAARLRMASWTLIALAVVCLIGRFVIWDLRWWIAARQLDHDARLLLGFFALIASSAVNHVTPTVRIVGGLVRARYIARGRAQTFGHAYGVVLYDQLVHNATMTGITWVALIAAAFALDYHEVAWSALAALVATAVGGLVWLRRGSPGGRPVADFLKRLAARRTGTIQRVLAHSQDAVDVFLRLLGNRRLHVEAVALGLGFFVLNALAQWIAFRALGTDVGVAVVIAAVSLGSAAGMLTGTPGGIGTTEAAMVASFVALGVDRVDAAAATILFRGLHYAVVLAIGVPSLLVLELRDGRRDGPGLARKAPDTRPGKVTVERRSRHG